ncbi:MAG: DEAD/DEAH box helicase family protein, partial [Verrucomicrobiota bacterium]|nr:DEAD/DEAH box helicase family protein [Verrucomicrobiota bacterium]
MEKTSASAASKPSAALEQSFAEARPRALIQMATGAGKTLTACAFTYRLIKHAGARNVLFLV